MHGYYEFTGSMGKNSLTSGLRGPNVIDFADGTRIRFNTIDFKLGGTVMGERTIEALGSICFEDIKSGLKAVVTMSTLQKTGWIKSSTTGSKDEFTGCIYQSNECTPLESTQFGNKQKLPESIDKCKDIAKKLSVITGSWLENVAFDDKKYWDVNEYTP